MKFFFFAVLLIYDLFSLEYAVIDVSFVISGSRRVDRKLRNMDELTFFHMYKHCYCIALIFANLLFSLIPLTSLFLSLTFYTFIHTIVRE